MPRENLRRRRRHEKKAAARTRREQTALQHQLEKRNLVWPPQLVRPDLAALGEPLFPPPPHDPNDRFTEAMARVARQITAPKIARSTRELE